jgi:hypothetical protein
LGDMKGIMSLGIALVLVMQASAQGYVAQEEIVSILDAQGIEEVKPVEWEVYHYNDNIKGDKKGYWSEFLTHIEDEKTGSHSGKRRYIVEMANRVSADNFKPGQTLLIPSHFPENYCAYSPYPLQYELAVGMAKLLIVDKFTQTFGAYENGKLVRWGIVSTGKYDETTPPGRYNFNWKAEYRQSSAAPEGELWEMYWMFNFHAAEGIHVHQYALPIAAPASHGCVRMSMADAQWNYKWANGWVRENGKLIRNGTPMMIIHSNPEGRPAHWALEDGKVVSLVKLPLTLEEIPAGTEAQRTVAWNSGW